MIRVGVAGFSYKEWNERAEEVAAKTEETFVVLNNHNEGRAAANAVQIAAMLGLGKREIPPMLLEKYPQLQEFQ